MLSNFRRREAQQSARGPMKSKEVVGGILLREYPFDVGCQGCYVGNQRHCTRKFL